MALVDPGTIEEGDPTVIRAEARELRSIATTMHTAARMLRMISTKGVWDSCAGTTFDAEVGSTPDDLVAIANRLAGAERIIRPYADRLETSQATLARLRRHYETNVRTAEARSARLATMTPEDPEYATVDREYRAASNAREMTKRSFEREAEDAATDERTVAQRLSVVGADLSDPRTYNLFEGSSRIGTSSLVTNPVVQYTPWGKPVQVLAMGDPVGKLGRRVVYGEGSYRDVGVSTVVTGAGVVLPKGAGTAARDAQRVERHKEAVAKVTRGARSTDPVTRRRIMANLKTDVRYQATKGAVRARHKGRDVFEEKSGVRMIDDMTADWAALAGSGHVKKGAHVITYSVRSADKVNDHVSTARSTADRVPSRDEPGDR